MCAWACFSLPPLPTFPPTVPGNASKKWAVEDHVAPLNDDVILASTVHIGPFLYTRASPACPLAIDRAELGSFEGSRGG